MSKLVFRTSLAVMAALALSGCLKRCPGSASCPAPEDPNFAQASVLPPTAR